MSKLDEILDLITTNYKEKSYSDLLKYIGGVKCFLENYKNESYYSEVHVLKENDSLKIMIQVSRNMFILRMFSKVKTFRKTIEGETVDIDHMEFWKKKEKEKGTEKGREGDRPQKGTGQ